MFQIVKAQETHYNHMRNQAIPYTGKRWRSAAAIEIWRKGQTSKCAEQPRLLSVLKTTQQCGRRCQRSCSQLLFFSSATSAPRVSSARGSVAVSPTQSDATMWRKGQPWRRTTGIKDCKFWDGFSTLVKWWGGACSLHVDWSLWTVLIHNRSVDIGYVC